MWLGSLGLGLLLALSLLAFYGLVQFSDGVSLQLLKDPYLHTIVVFSLKQAFLSTVLAVGIGYVVARVLYYCPRLWGRSLFLSLCLLGFIMPTLVLITGLVVLFGRSGWLAPWLGEGWRLYGLSGILMAHVYLNVPFVVRAVMVQLQSIPDNGWCLARQLKLSAGQRWWIVEWGSVRGRLLVVSGLVFVLCFNSFAVVLALGGGPQATTLEVAIYQALKYDFNIPEALVLAWLQLAIVGSLLLVLTRFSANVWLVVDKGDPRYIPSPRGVVLSVYRLIYGGAWVLLVLPLWALVLEVCAAESRHWYNPALVKPTLITLSLGLACAVSAVAWAYCLLLPVRWASLTQPRWLWVWDWLGLHTLVVPAMVLSVGLYMALLQWLDLEQWGMVWVWLINTALLTPFAVQHLRSPVLQFDAHYHRLRRSLKLTLYERWRIEWVWLRASLGAAGILVLLLAMGDVAIFAIFGSERYMTLPWLIYSYAGSYRMTEAAVAALWLLWWCGLIVWVWETFNQRYTLTEASHVKY